MAEYTSFVALALWLIQAGGAGIAAYALMDKVPALVALLPEVKRYVGWCISAGLAWLAFFLLGFVANVWAVIETGVKPVGWQQWFTTLFSVGALGLISAEKIHAQRDLRAKGAVKQRTI